jgi:hypothetical protein
MAAVANQVHSTAQQIGARIGWNPTDAATQPPTTRERVLNVSDPRTDHRNLGFEDSSPKLTVSREAIRQDQAGAEMELATGHPFDDEHGTAANRTGQLDDDLGISCTVDCAKQRTAAYEHTAAPAVCEKAEVADAYQATIGSP